MHERAKKILTRAGYAILIIKLTWPELVSCDIVSLYTSIPHSLGMKAMEYWIEREKAMLPPRFTKEFIMVSILFILNHNNFLFDNVLYHQLHGTGIMFIIITSHVRGLCHRFFQT